ncbi:MAG: retropepsin-like aspartic protease [Ferruginibacter sp.]
MNKEVFEQALLILFMFCCINCTTNAQTQSPEKLVYTKQFTLLNKNLDEGFYNKIPHKDVYKAIVLNAFSKSAASNELITASLAKHFPLPDSLRFYLMQAQVNNFIALDDYKNAYASGTDLLKNFPAFFNAEQKEDEQEALKIWNQLIKVKPQELKKTSDTRLALKRDMAGLWNIPVTVNDSARNFIFDSGAGISTITDSYAQLLGLQMLDSSEVDVKSGITGFVNKSKLGVAKELHIGNIIVNNAVFLVFADSALTFANGAYKIKGIIGFPIIKSMGSFTIKKNEIYIPVKDTAAPPEPNMAIDQLKPVIYLSYNGDVLPFTFDTGARTSMFSDNFYNKYRSSLDKDGTEKQTTLGGAGGSKQFKILEMPVITLKNYNQDIVLKKAAVSKEKLDTNESYYFGNLGQDVIKQFVGMTINFEKSVILFE